MDLRSRGGPFRIQNLGITIPSSFDYSVGRGNTAGARSRNCPTSGDAPNPSVDTIHAIIAAIDDVFDNATRGELVAMLPPPAKPETTRQPEKRETTETMNPNLSETTTERSPDLIFAMSSRGVNIDSGNVDDDQLAPPVIPSPCLKASAHRNSRVSMQPSPSEMGMETIDSGFAGEYLVSPP